MVEKLPLDFVRKIYNLLTTGNDDVNFYCMCLQNQNREAATNSPVKFALSLIKINIMCRLPFSKDRIFSAEIGNTYLSEIFVRPAISETASGMLDNAEVITDIFGSAFTVVISREELFENIEAETGVHGFARLRSECDDCKIPLKNIYRKINNELNTSVDYKIELNEIAKHLFPNKYVIRLLDIAKCNNMRVCAVVNTSYPGELVKGILNRYEIHPDELYISCEDEIDIKNDIIKNPAFTCILSSDYKGFIKKFTKYGCKPLYYRNPNVLMERTEHPRISDEFKKIYDTICGLRLFNGIKRMSREYELSYLCIAPAAVGFAQRAAEKADKGEKIICLCDEHSVFGLLMSKLAEKTENVIYFPWSALAASKYKPVDKWAEIIEEMPVFDNAESGVFDPLLRYPVSESAQIQSPATFAQIMATAWKDKTSSGVNSAVERLVSGTDKVVIADPIAGNCSSAEFCGILESVSANTVYNCLTMSNYLDGRDTDLKPLARIMQGNKPLLYQIDGEDKKWIYQEKLSRSKLREIYNAIYDFADDFSDYINGCGKYFISGKDACKLYCRALPALAKRD
ncbi:MAG: hypothetical protein LUF33_06095 [Clostridiales bacterium]|nr:hypothetical protein [Clostridiales bacterium]